MSNYEATKYDFDAANLTGIELIPTATIVPWTAASIPTGFLECNGANVSRSTYSALFAEIGTTYGAGDGSSTFGLPDLQDNCCISKSGTKALGSTGGANTVTATGNDFAKQAIGLLALIAATLATFIILFIAAKSEKIINKRVISIFSRIVAIVLAGLSIQYILDGIKTFMNL